jgi:uncharacterized protein YbjT (DUF2867 family)
VIDGLIAVTGATGELGGRVARRLAARGVSQRLVVRDPARAPRVSGAEVVTAGFEDSAALRAALAGVPTLFLVSASETEDRVAVHRAAVDAAVAAGVRRIVYTSFLAPAPDATFTFARDHFHTEEYIRATGVPFVFLRDSLYQDMFPRFVRPDGVLLGPAGDGRVAPVARDDVADVAVEVLLDDRHDGQALDVTGPAAITMAEAAQQLSIASGRPIRYECETLAQAYQSRAGYGAPQWEVDGWIGTYLAIGAGEWNVVSDTVARIAGHPAMSLAEFLAQQPSAQ